MRPRPWTRRARRSTASPAPCASGCSRGRPTPARRRTRRSGSARSSTARRRCSTRARAPRSSPASPSARSGSGRSSRCWRTPRSTRCWCAARRRRGSSGAGGSSPPTSASRGEGELRARDRAHPRPARPPRRRGRAAVDARLPDGSRVNVVIPPLALDGPVLTIRRFRRRGFTPDELVANGTLTAPLAELLARAVRRRCNLLVCGGTGSGKTTLLNALSVLHRPRRARGHDRGRRRAAPPPAARAPARGAPAEPRGPRRGRRSGGS